MEIPNFFVIFHHVWLQQSRFPLRKHRLSYEDAPNPFCSYGMVPYADSRESKKDRTSLSKGNPVFFYIILLTYLKFCRLWR